jgi:hypothetical protein
MTMIQPLGQTPEVEASRAQRETLCQALDKFRVALATIETLRDAGAFRDAVFNAVDSHTRVIALNAIAKLNQRGVYLTHAESKGGDR